MKELKIINDFKLDITEPSGLAITPDGKELWTVSDKNGRIYKISTEGKILDEIITNKNNLEGITIYNDSALAVVSEKSNSVIILDNYGNELNEIKIDLTKSVNSGLEGITFNKKNKHPYLVKEKGPSLLIELDTNFEIINKVNLDFSSDVSGIDYDESENCFWILSDEDESVFKCSIEGKPLSSFKIKITKPEGIAVFEKKIYIVSDYLEKLFILTFE
jgi:uncharacterized protein YjiK